MKLGRALVWRAAPSQEKKGCALKGWPARLGRACDEANIIVQSAKIFLLLATLLATSDRHAVHLTVSRQLEPSVDESRISRARLLFNSTTLTYVELEHAQSKWHTALLSVADIYKGTIYSALGPLAIA